MVVTARWQMSHARRPDVFQTGVLPPTQADSFLPRRSSLSGLLTIPQTLGGRDPGKTAKKKFQACAIRVLVGWISIHGFLPIIHRLNICIYIYISTWHTTTREAIGTRYCNEISGAIWITKKRNLSSRRYARIENPRSKLWYDQGQTCLSFNYPQVLLHTEACPIRSERSA